MTLERDIKFDYSIESFNISINMTNRNIPLVLEMKQEIK